MIATILVQISEPTWVASIIAAGASLLAIPVVSSAVTGALRRFTDSTGLDPRILVWVVAAGVTIVTYAQAPLTMPAFDSANPGAWVSGWLLIVTGASELSKVLYDRLLREWPIFRQPSE